MKFAIISDIHGNYEAFSKVLTDLETTGVTESVCIGDCVGYGPEPEQVLDEVIRRNIPTTLGNHEMAVIDERVLKWFNPKARESVKKTKAMLGEAASQFIRGLPSSLVVHGCRCVHGYPPDSVRAYLFQKAPHALIKTFKSMAEPICFVGHTHELSLVHFNGRHVETRPLGKGITQLNEGQRYIVNVGSVGQPRDGNNTAKYAIYNTESHELEIRFVPYDIAATVAKIKAAGLPESHGTRLW